MPTHKVELRRESCGQHEEKLVLLVLDHSPLTPVTLCGSVFCSGFHPDHHNRFLRRRG